MLIQILWATRRVSVGTSVAKGRHGLTAQAARLRQGPVPAELGGSIQPAQFCQPALEIGVGIVRIPTDLDVHFLERAKELILTVACDEHGSSCA